MCDLFSWIELDAGSSKKHHGRKELFLTDYEVKILRGRKGRLWSDSDVVGHSAIEAYYKNAYGSHEEGRDKIPPVMAECVMAGKMDGMIAGILGKDRKKWPKYRKDGTRILAADDPNNPEWVLKSIVYYCKNYTIDKKDLSKKIPGAISTYLAGRGDGVQSNVDRSICWSGSPQKEEFWGGLWFLTSGENYDGSKKRVTAWTAAEKRMIAKMPKVKR